MDPATKKPVGVFTAESFGLSKSGRANIEEYMQICSKLYQSLTGQSLMDQKGLVQVLKPPVSWSGVVARVHLFFDRLLCTKKIGQSGPAITSANFSKAVWRKFSEVAPTVQNGAKPFLVFIQDIDKQALPALPVPH